MIAPFTFQNTTKIHFGEGVLSRLGEELQTYGKTVLLVYGGGSIKKSGVYDTVLSQIAGAGLRIIELGGIEPNPRVESVQKGAELCKAHGVDVVLAVGGGSTIDAGKFICASACYDGDPWKLTTGEAEIKCALPLVSVLTLAATGSEMNSGGVISNLALHQKMGRFSPHLQPRASFLDPTLTYTVGKYQTACGAADILSHTMETYFAPGGAFSLLDEWMEGIMRTVVRYAPIALASHTDYDARSNLMWAGTWAINGLLKSGRTYAWSCHPMEHELSAFYDVTHGLGLAILTPRWMEYILSEQTAPRMARFGEKVFGVAPSGDVMADAKAAIRALEGFLFGTLGLSRTLTEIGIGEENISAMAAQATEGGNLQTAFVSLDQKDVENIYRACL